MRSNGTVAVWGDLTKRAAEVPTNLVEVKAVAAGWEYCVALQSNGTVVTWGDNLFGQTNAPASLTNITAISAYAQHTVALREDGTVVAWGAFGAATNVPSGLTNVLKVAAGGVHSLALLADETVEAWGGNNDGQCNVPAGLTGVKAIAAGWQHSLAIRSGRLAPVIVQQPTNQAALPGGSATFTVNVSGLAALSSHWTPGLISLSTAGTFRRLQASLQNSGSRSIRSRLPFQSCSSMTFPSRLNRFLSRACSV